MTDPDRIASAAEDWDEGSERLSELAEAWAKHAGFEPAGRDGEKLAAHLLEAALEEAGREGACDRDLLEELAARGEVGAAWDAIEALHLGLDRALDADEITAGDARRLRRGLTRLQSRLHRAGLHARLATRRALMRDITHDLRVPLNSIVFLTDSLFDETHGELTSTQRRKLGGVYSASTTLLNFVNDLLDLSQSTAEDFECASVPFSIRGVLEDARHLVRPVADYHGADLEIDNRTQDSWQGDPRLVRRILLNLVTNALEAAGEGGEVAVRVETGDGDDPRMQRIVVSDTGPGIDLDRAEALLDPGDPAGWKRLLDGTDGLGLLIIGRLVRAAGGAVEVGRPRSGGTRFQVELPFGGDNGGG